MKDWFPTVKANVFISHSHKDLEKITSLVGLLHKKFSLTPFADFCVWDYADKLLQAIDKNTVSIITHNGYSYDKRDYYTAHVHTMFSISLAKMIDDTECLFFVNTDNLQCYQAP
ncbi:MAG: hypothetical protein LBT18_05505 [Endomicrobium sp.]|nr:hypothetical protein [Endomicrobium sp.]